MIDLLDLHTHTTASGHAYNSLYEMARSASERGMRVFGCSDHAPAMPGTCHYYQDVYKRQAVTHHHALGRACGT